MGQRSSCGRCALVSVSVMFVAVGHKFCNICQAKNAIRSSENQYVYSTYRCPSLSPPAHCHPKLVLLLFGSPHPYLPLSCSHVHPPGHAHYAPQTNHTQTTEMSRKFSFMAPLTPFAISTILSIACLPACQLTSCHCPCPCACACARWYAPRPTYSSYCC